MKVLHIISGLNTGGAETMLLRIVTSLSTVDVEHIIICLGKGGQIANLIYEKGIQLYILNGKGRLSGPNLILKAHFIVKKIKPDIIQGWMYDGNFTAWCLATFNNIACIWNIRHSIADINREKLSLRILIRISIFLSTQAKAIIYNSHVAADQHHKLGFCKKNAIVIPNGFDTGSLKPDSKLRRLIREELKLKNEDFLVGMIARYHPMKDHKNFLKAALNICRNFPNTYFILVGKHVDKNNRTLTKIIDDTPFNNRFFLLGERMDIHAIHCALDLAISSSAWGEGFSNVLAEAMAAEVTCISTDVGDARYIIGDTGFIISPENTIELEKAIQNLLVNSYLRNKYKKQARKHIQDNFNIKVIEKSYINLWASKIENSINAI